MARRGIIKWRMAADRLIPIILTKAFFFHRIGALRKTFLASANVVARVVAIIIGINETNYILHRS